VVYRLQSPNMAPRGESPGATREKPTTTPNVPNEQKQKRTWNPFSKGAKPQLEKATSTGLSTDNEEEPKRRIDKWSMGVLNDKYTDEVPGSLPIIADSGCC
jgi:hypothetical protein